MKPAGPQKLEFAIANAGAVSALLDLPQQARACYVFAHGAGAGMTHSFMAAVAAGLAERGVATLRYQFPYMEKGSKRPDAPAVAHAAVRAAVKEAARRCPGLPLIAGGKSFGGRMTSQAQASAPLAGVRGLAFFGFPAASGRQAVRRSRQTSFRDQDPDAVPAGHPRQPRGIEAAGARGQAARPIGDAASCRGRRSFLPCAGALGTQRRRGDARNSRCVFRTG